LRPYLLREGIDAACLQAGPDLEAVVLALRERAKTLVEMARGALFFYRAPTEAVTADRDKHLRGRAELLQKAAALLGELPSWDATSLHDALQSLAAAESEGKLGKIAQPLRVAVAGCAVSPPLDQTLAILGREESLARLRRALAWTE